ncbi:hypothetical protein ACFQ4N_09220 [Oceanobacillus iheyensis]|uniref:hypothetical protein n=1 Tax=Oceanobacillus iheyensis TaxID=182710 RepID=UPI00363B4690
MNEMISAEHFDRLVSLYQWSFTIFITIITIVIAFMGIIQWRLSSKQIEKMKKDTKKELVNQFRLDEIETFKKQLSKTESRLNLVIENYKGNYNPFTATTLEQHYDYTIGQILERVRFYEGELLPDNVSLASLSEVNKMVESDDYRELLSAGNLNDLKLIEMILDRKTSNSIRSKDEYRYFKEKVKDIPDYVDL